MSSCQAIVLFGCISVSLLPLTAAFRIVERDNGTVPVPSSGYDLCWTTDPDNIGFSPSHLACVESGVVEFDGSVSDTGSYTLVWTHHSRRSNDSLEEQSLEAVLNSIEGFLWTDNMVATLARDTDPDSISTANMNLTSNVAICKPY